MTTFTELAEDVGTAGDAEATASAICAHLKLSALAREVLWPIIAAECESIERVRVRRIEQAVTISRKGREANITGERSALMRETFALGDGRRIEWGKATAEEHQARLDMLAKMRDGLDATMSRHQDAIDLLRSSGVKCLDDLAVFA